MNATARWFWALALAGAMAGCGGGSGAVELPGEDVLGDEGPDVPAPAPILAGVGQANIDPTFEPYTDTNGNHVWDAGEPFEDANGNDTLDTLWMGGFGMRQPTGTHDPLTARTLALRFGGETYLFTALDTVGFGMSRVHAVKAGVAAALGAGAIDPNRMFIASIHTHQVPDTVGVFAGSVNPGWDETYLRHVVDGAVASIVAAVGDLKPAHLLVANASGDGLVRDIVPPVILDPYVGILQAVGALDGKPIATMATISNHPEAAWADNTLISADFPHYMRNKLEADLGGMALYFSADQGLMQTCAEIGPPGFERAQKIGESYAERIAAAVKAAVPLADEEVIPTFGYGVAQVTLENFGLAMLVQAEVADGYKDYIYVVDGEGPCSGFGCMDLPLPVLRLGSKTTIFCVPAEVTPELVVGGIVAPDTYESQYPDAPPEPILMDHIRTPDRFFMGLCGSDVGYLYPKITGNLDAVYDQQNGPGPGCAATFLTGLEAVLDEVNTRASQTGGTR
jgi:hypothetical protein